MWNIQQKGFVDEKTINLLIYHILASSDSVLFLEYKTTIRKSKQPTLLTQTYSTPPCLTNKSTIMHTKLKIIECIFFLLTS